MVLYIKDREMLRQNAALCGFEVKKWLSAILAARVPVIGTMPDRY
jgi:hypothetical protein